MTNRKIAFRAWDSRTKKWYASYNGPFIWALEGGWNGGEAPSETVSQLPNGIELMQFTGLTDKNGKEIYEGDILQSAKDKSLRQKVQWEEHDPADDMDVSHYGYHLNPYWGEVEVIGNVFDNPELLNHD